VNTIKEIQQWKWRKDEKTNTYTDEPVAFMDDAMAMLRYSIEQERRSRPKLNTGIKGGI
jgi:phage terminase large subunit